jgi:hypothetical protein
MLLVLLCAIASRLHASSMLTGRMITVSPYGAQDTARNPALLSSQNQNNNIGITARYSLTALADIDLKEFKPVLSKVTIDKYNSGSARISYARTIDRFTLGFDYYYNTETDTLRQTIDTITGGSVIGQGKSKDRNMANLFTIALSAAPDPSHAIGIRVNCSYLNNIKTDKTQYYQIPAPPVYINSYNKTAFEQVSTLPGIGYFGRFGTSEIGLMITTGRFTWRKTEKDSLTYDLSSGIAQLLFKAKGTIPFTHSYTMGPSMIAGFHVRPSFDIGAGLELEVSLPVTYRESFLIPGNIVSSPSVITRLNYFTSSTLGLKNRVALKPSMSIRGGGEFSVSRTTIFNLGIGFGYNAYPSSVSGVYPAPLEVFFSDYKIVSVLGTAGFDFLVGKNSTITIGAAATYTSSSQTQGIKETLSIFSTEVSIKSVTVDLTAAASIGF